MVEQRANGRRRTRMRVARLAAADGTFLADCAVHDRSPDGGRLRVDADLKLPGDLVLYEEETDCLSTASLVWRQGGEVGVRIAPALKGAARQVYARLTGNFYAMTVTEHPRAPATVVKSAPSAPKPQRQYQLFRLFTYRQ